MTRNLGKDGGGRRAPSERGSYKVRAFPHILSAIASKEERSRNGRREGGFVILALYRKQAW